MKKIFALCLVWVCAQLTFAADKSFITVAKDGSGDFSTVQEAINSVPADNASYVTIYIKNGVYQEHVLIDKSYLALIGEDREKTRIDYSINREEWKKARNQTTNNGSGTVDIGISVKDTFTTVPVNNIVIGNCTVVNVIAVADSMKSYTHGIRGEGSSTKIWVIHCNVLVNGRDTIGLWNKTTGMYYHTDCSFRGTNDAVCPRGWCYAVACDFHEVASNAPIWHEGKENTSQKFVIRTPKIDNESPKNFILAGGEGSFAIYLLDGIFSDRLTDPNMTSGVFYHNCTGGGPFYKNNLSSAPGAPKQNEITARWTFKDAPDPWDPENTMPAVLPFAALPQPWNKAYEIPSNITLRWIRGRDATSNAVYFGTTNPPPFVKSQSETSYQPGNLKSGTYYWRVDAVNGNETVKGTVWSFTVDQSVSVIDDRSNSAGNGYFLDAMQRSDGGVTINYNIGTAVPVACKLFDLMGKEVAKFPVAQTSDKVHVTSYDMKQQHLTAGMYMMRLITDRFELTSPVMVK
jgi:pectinesterase